MVEPQSENTTPEAEGGETEKIADSTAVVRQGPTWKASEGNAANKGNGRPLGDKYGSWMIAMRKPRNYQNNADPRKQYGRNTGERGESSKGQSGGNQRGNSNNFNKEGFKI